MLNHECVSKPLGIGLNMLVDPFFCSWRQWAEEEHGSFITHRYIGRGFEFDFHVIWFLQVLSTCRICPSGRPPWNAVLSSVGGDAASGTPLLMRIHNQNLRLFEACLWHFGTVTQLFPQRLGASLCQQLRFRKSSLDKWLGELEKEDR